MASAQISFTSPSDGNFSVQHGLGYTPDAAVIVMTSAGAVWFQPILFDSTNVYLVASDVGLTGILNVYASTPCGGCVPIALSTETQFVTTQPGNFTLPHNLGTTPGTVILQITDAGICWFQSVPYDSSNLYLVASDAGVTGYALSYAPQYAGQIF